MCLTWIVRATFCTSSAPQLLYKSIKTAANSLSGCHPCVISCLHGQPSLPTMLKSVQLSLWIGSVLLQMTGHPLREGCTMERIEEGMKGHFVYCEEDDLFWDSHHPRSGVTQSLGTSALFSAVGNDVSSLTMNAFECLTSQERQSESRGRGSKTHLICCLSCLNRVF